MENDVVQEVLDRIDAVGEAISRGAVAGFEVLVKQAIVSGIGYVLFALGLIAIGTAIIKITRNNVRTFEADRKKIIDRLGDKVDETLQVPSRDSYGSYRSTREIKASKYLDDAYGFYLAMRYLQLVGVLFYAWALYPVYMALAHFVNPAYYAIYEVLQTFGR